MNKPRKTIFTSSKTSGQIFFKEFNSIFQEAFRYNALHIVSKFNQAEICQLYIDTIEDAAFLKLMYPTDTPETTTSRINFLLDLYLNMPEKGVSIVAEL
jgi:hypothetical protein